MILSSCEFKCNIGSTDSLDKKESDKKESGTTNNNNAGGSNDVVLNAKGVSVTDYYLATEDGERLTNNTVRVGEKIALIIKGARFTVADGKSFIGISERISTDNGTEILNAPDLFAKYDETGIPSEMTEQLKIKAYVTETRPEIKYFNVEYRVWDKRGDGEITGNFKFKVSN